MQAQDFADDVRRWRVWEQLNREEQQIEPPSQYQDRRTGTVTYGSEEF
jgi:hypothetical protein